MKLMTMTDFVLWQRKLANTDNTRRFWACEKYAKFLKTPVELSMFVPCDDKGNVLEEPIYGQYGNEQYEACEWEEYLRAKERVLFEGFYTEISRSLDSDITGVIKNKKGRYIGILYKNKSWQINDGNIGKNIEDCYLYGVGLTDTAIKKLGL